MLGFFRGCYYFFFLKVVVKFFRLLEVFGVRRKIEVVF